MRLVNTEKLYVINVYHIINEYDMACMFNHDLIILALHDMEYIGNFSDL